MCLCICVHIYIIYILSFLKKKGDYRCWDETLCCGVFTEIWSIFLVLRLWLLPWLVRLGWKTLPGSQQALFWGIETWEPTRGKLIHQKNKQARWTHKGQPAQDSKLTSGREAERPISYLAPQGFLNPDPCCENWGCLPPFWPLPWSPGSRILLNSLRTIEMLKTGEFFRGFLSEDFAKFLGIHKKSGPWKPGWSVNINITRGNPALYFLTKALYKKSWISKCYPVQIIII